MHLRRAGAGHPIILLHQSPSSSSMWEPLLPELAARGFDTIALDLPGLGMSDPPTSPPTLDDYAAAVAAAVRALGLDRVDVVGHHSGASVALALTAREPRLVRRLVAYGIALLDEEWRTKLRDQPPPVFSQDCAEQQRWWGQLWESTGAVAPIVVPRTAAELFLAGRRASWAHNAVGAADHVVLMRELAVPLLGLAGTREGLRTQTEEACALSPWARFELMGDVGGFVADEAPADLADAVAAFLRLPDASVLPAPSGADR